MATSSRRDRWRCASRSSVAEDAERRHGIAGLDVLTVANEARDVGLRQRHCVDADRASRAEMREIRADDRRAAAVPRIVWHAPQPAARNSSRPRAVGMAKPARRRGGPGVAARSSNSAGGMATTSQSHQRVRAAAILRALASKHARLRGSQAQICGAARDHVDLAAKVRHPEAMNHVGGLAARRRRCGRRECGSRWRRNGATQRRG